MKKLFLISLIIVQSCVAFAQDYCENDTIVREIQFPLTEYDTETVLYYFNNEWIPLAYGNEIKADSIQSAEIKNDEYGNRAVFFTVSPGYLEYIKAENRKYLINLDPRCEFPGGNGKLKEWINENIRIPEGFKGSERVLVEFTVHPDGSISDAKIYRRPSENEAVNQEALRLVNALPKFRVKYYTPQKKNLHFTLPIRFKEPGAIFIRGKESQDNTHKQDSTSHDNVNEPVVLVNPHMNPYYLNGGHKGFNNDLYAILLKTAPVSQDSIKGHAAVSFIISEDGQIDHNTITVDRNRSVPDDYLKAAIEAVKKLGKFEPGKLNGTPKRVRYIIRIDYPVPLDKINAVE